jgi:spermidine synthase
LALNSASYYLLAGALLVVILLPWSIAMGATYPFAMAAFRELGIKDTKFFSFLYLANVLGAILGVLLPPIVLVEFLGFAASLHATAILNFFIGFTALLVSLRVAPAASAEPEPLVTVASEYPLPPATMLGVLFLTGLVSMAMEVVWIRQFTPFIGTSVYAFAFIVAFYLAGTFLGSQFYRFWSRSHNMGETAFSWMFLGLTSLLTLLMADPTYGYQVYAQLAWGIIPFTFLTGILTPMLVDGYSSGNPERAGKAYAVNVWGCILGPLLSGFILLPVLGERWSLITLSLPLFALPILLAPSGDATSSRTRVKAFAVTGILAGLLVWRTGDFEQMFTPREVRRDYTATAMATGDGMYKQLYTNGHSLTFLTPITKTMAHFPLAMLDHTPKSALVICFGMGTTHRSLLSWGISSTAVELLPSVPRLYSYFHADGPQVLQSPQSTLVIDDGRMFLEKTDQQYDLITLDPPPPISAAGVSLLYSQEFYEVAKKHLAPGGILQQWTAQDFSMPENLAAITLALQKSFPYVRAFGSVSGWGVHFLASMSPLPQRTPEEMAQRMPPAAIKDLIEWGPGQTPQRQFAIMLGREYPLSKLLETDPSAEPLHDDRPVNEYWFMHKYLPSPWYKWALAMTAPLREPIKAISFGEPQYGFAADPHHD